jgi:AcrR family transcriptional regulator
VTTELEGMPVDVGEEPPEDSPRQGRGRPRLPTTKAAILQATVELLTEAGVRGTTTNAIAARSGCSKATIYRRWPTLNALILDALRTLGERPGNLRPIIELERELGSTIHAATRRGTEIIDSAIFRAVFPTIALELLSGEAIGERFRTDVFLPVRTNGKARVREAVARGELAPEVDADLVFDLLYGALLYRLLMGEPLNDDVARRLADLIMKGAAGGGYSNHRNDPGRDRRR